MKIILKKNEEKRINNGHLWVFSNEIGTVEGNPENGDIVQVFDAKNNFIGRGFYNKNSLISIRLFPMKNELNFSAYAYSMLMNAFQFRKTLYPNRESFRLCFSESDFIPGLIIDKYNDTFVLQVYSAGIEKNIKSIVSILCEHFGAKNIFTKNESHFRIMEGLNDEDTIYLGERNSEIIYDGKIKYKINFEESHKTGFYFDQSDNRFFIEKFVTGKSVLDAFCNSGGFGLHTAISEANEITFVDSSAVQIENVKENYQLNSFSVKSEYIVSDVFDFLEVCHINNRKFDIVMIDPPAFAKNKKSLAKGKKGYERLNKLAANVINDGGFLITSSCSHHLDEKEFINILAEAISKAKRKGQLIHFGGASMDHPRLPVMPETNYLKFAVMRIL